MQVLQCKTYAKAEEDDWQLSSTDTMLSMQWRKKVGANVSVQPVIDVSKVDADQHILSTSRGSALQLGLQDYKRIEEGFGPDNAGTQLPGSAAGSGSAQQPGPVATQRCDVMPVDCSCKVVAQTSNGLPERNAMHAVHDPTQVSRQHVRQSSSRTCCQS